ncbi:MAG: glycosyltransferase [Lachnospiraceae bacterium]|nr:glycosyltransferase [Lachnospiraceae bacterium]
MSIFDRRKLMDSYTDEVRKQTDPYGYFCQNEKIRRGEDKPEETPDGPSFYDVYDLRSVVFAEETDATTEEIESSDYLFIRSRGVTYEELELKLSMAENPGADIVYWDEDRVIDGRRHAPYFKPGWSPDTLLNYNYIGDSYMISTTLALRVINIVRNEWCDRELTDINNNTIAGEDDLERRGEDEIRYDFLLRATELTGSILHIPAVAAHIPDETADEDEIYSDIIWKNQSQKFIKIRNEALKRRGVKFTYEKVFERKDNNVINNNAINNIVIKPSEPGMSLSVIIPSKNNSGALIKCLNSIKERFVPSGGNRLEIIIVDNGSGSMEGAKIEDYLRLYTSAIPVKYLYVKMDFNFSKMCNIGAAEATMDNLLFLNDDIELADDGTFERMCAYASMDHVGAVGAKLYYPGGNVIQHSGITVSLDCGPTHKLATFPDDKPYYYGRNIFDFNVLAVTGACLMISREKFFKYGSFNDKMSVGYNDVELCVRLHEAGLYNVVLNECILFHHESLSRGQDHKDDAKYARLKEERQLLYDLHPWILTDKDPYYNPNLIPDTLAYTVNIMADHAVRSSRNALIEDQSLDNKLSSILGRYRSDREAGKARLRRGSRRLHFNIERTGFFRGIMKDEEDYYQIEGWATLTKRDNAMYSTQLAFIDEEGECLIFDTFRQSREDVSVVFVNEKNLFLTGFVCKIPASMIKRDETYRVAVIKKSGLTGIKYAALGDYYEPARGYRSEEG